MKRARMRAHVIRAEPDDTVHSPKGEVMYHEPKIQVPGWEAHVLVIGDRPLGVVVIRPGMTELRYCDREGIVHREPLPGFGREAIMHAGLKRMAEIFVVMFGERHPLAEQASANVMPV